ncbi:uncharacterized protein LOC134444325 [Engraulis encrasicolus]|uniref:uncharacterized protein LOC134444325 n=1 Tax=Engraulis encrasicolus TaxID=184585 RepID=UPI002FD50ED2
MFSRNCFNGQDGVGAPQYGRHKPKSGAPKKRAPNPKVALMIRGKIHRLLHASGEQVPHNPCPYYAGILEEEEEDEKDGTDSDLRRRTPRRDRYGHIPDITNGQAAKDHAAHAGVDYVGEVELNREGCVRIPCTLQQSSNLAQPLRTSSQAMSDFNGSRFLAEMGCVGGAPFSYTAVGHDRIVEEDEDEEEEETSAIVDHILKELRGINKIQAEISDLREYLTSVRGSVDEVSSCVEAVLTEIEGMRSGTKPTVESWAGATGLKDGMSPVYHEKCSSSYSAMMDTSPKADCPSNFMSQKGFRVHDNQLPDGRSFGSASAYKSMCTSANVDSQNPDEVHAELESFDQSANVIPAGARARKLSFGYLERQDGQDCPSTSSLSSGHSSKSESDPDRIEPECPENHGWSQVGLPRSASCETGWSEEDYERGHYFRQGSFEDGDSCIDEGHTWELCKLNDDEACSTLGRSSAGSSEHLSYVSSRHYNSPASTSSREEWLAKKKRRAQAHDEEFTGMSSEDLVLECSGPSSHYSPAKEYESKVVEYVHSRDTFHGITGTVVNHDGDTSEHAHLETPETSSLEQSHCKAAGQPGSTLEELNTNIPNSDGSRFAPSPDNAGSTVKRIGKAVLDFKSVLWVALKKLEGAQSPVGDKTEVMAPPSSSPSTETLVVTPCPATPDDVASPEGVSASPKQKKQTLQQPMPHNLKTGRNFCS